ncbi:hypothetical protein, partial [Microcystis aeruginosa]|uniref:hypothetical protein n=1 Tax=Microcystis aeruginosa TaxID=1126 RepID=UPI001C12CA1A
QFFRSLLDLQYIFSSAFFCLKLDNFFQISSFFIPQNKIDALLGFLDENNGQEGKFQKIWPK